MAAGGGRKRKKNLLSLINPINKSIEKHKFLKNTSYNPNFLYCDEFDEETARSFAVASSKYLPQAIGILERVREKFGSFEVFAELSGGKVLCQAECEAIIEEYKQAYGIELKVNFRHDLTAFASLTRKGQEHELNLRTPLEVREHWLVGTLDHEIGTHYLRSMNDQRQVFAKKKEKKKMGFRPHLATEEGFACLNTVISRKDKYLWRPALLYYTAYKASISSFANLYRDLGQYVQSPHVRWDYCVRAKRGCHDTAEHRCFAKDQAYLEGALDLLSRRHLLDFRDLYLGKFAIEDLEKVKRVANPKAIRLPHFLKDIKRYRRLLDMVAETNGL